MAGSSASMAVLAVVIILALIGGAVIAFRSGSTQTVTATNTPTSSGGAGSPSAPAPGEGTSESYNAPVKVVKQLNINIGNAPNVIKISKFAMTIYAGTGNVTVDMMLPNPCYNATLRYEPSNATVLLVIKSPSQGTMCVQVLKPLSLSTSITAPPSGQVTFIVIVDGQVAAEVPISLPS